MQSRAFLRHFLVIAAIFFAFSATVYAQTPTASAFGVESFTNLANGIRALFTNKALMIVLATILIAGCGILAWMGKLSFGMAARILIGAVLVFSAGKIATEIGDGLYDAGSPSSS